jgi:tetratricopeptide (TPR) repeat protein
LEHRSREEIARFIQDVCSERDASETYAHLVKCPDCFRQYVRLAGASSEWLRAELGLHRYHAPIGRMRRVSVAAVALLAVLVLAGDQVPAYRPDPALVAAAGYDSQMGLVMPGTEHFSAEPAPAMRAATVPESIGPAESSLDRALAELERRQEVRPLPADRAAWLVTGYLARGDLDRARFFAGEARRRYPDDPRLAVLSAVVAYRESRLDEAESLLREVVRRAPHDPTAQLDLAVVLAGNGRVEEARHLARRVEGRWPATLPGRRARALLDATSR